MRSELRRRRAPRGLTIVELLVAVALSGLVLASIFAVLTTTSRNFRVQTDLSQSMDGLNFAMETIKNDLRRASFMTVPNTAIGIYPNYTAVCGNPPFAPNGLQALVVSDGGAAWVPDAADRIFERVPDSVLMLGNYRSAERFTTYLATPGTFSARAAARGRTLADLQHAFGGAIVALQARTGGTQFMRVQSGPGAVTMDAGVLDRFIVNFQDQIQSTPGPETDICRFSGLVGDNLDLIPLHYIRYNVVLDESEGTTLLIREELDSAGTTMQSYVVARNVVDFQIWFDETISPIGTPPQLARDGEAGRVWTDDQGSMPMNAIDGSALARPEQARYAYIQISVRLNTQLPGLPLVPTASVPLRDTVELQEFESGSWNRTGVATRVLTMRGEVELLNFTLSDL